MLADIRRRVEADGPRVAVADPGRASQFMPFAALRGYGELVDEAEREAGDDGTAGNADAS